MAKVTYSLLLAHTTDADFRLWGKGLSDGLAAAGLTKTTDTGQIDWTTVTKPGTNTIAGYEIWRFNDAAQATYPIYIKLTYGTFTSISYPYLGFYIGSGSDGAGNLTGLGSDVVGTTNNHCASGSNTPGGVSTPSYICYNTTYGSLTALIHVGTPAAGISAHMFFHVSRATGSDGLVYPGVVSAIYMGTSYNISTPPGIIINHLDSTAGANWQKNAGNHHAMMFAPTGFWTNLSVSGTPQVYCGHVSAPTTYPNTNMCAGHNSDFTLTATFTATLVGGVQKTYIMAPQLIGYQVMAAQVASTGEGGAAAFLWE